MFLIFGDKHRTETVPDGMRVERECPKCKTVATFRERRVSKQFRLYFVDMFTHGTHHVLECGECGEAFVTDEVAQHGLENDQSGTVFGHLKGAVEKGKELASDPRVGESLGRAQEEATKAIAARPRPMRVPQSSAESVWSASVAEKWRRRPSVERFSRGLAERLPCPESLSSSARALRLVSS